MSDSHLQPRFILSQRHATNVKHSAAIYCLFDRAKAYFLNWAGGPGQKSLIDGEAGR
jgi:hypothetical protein